MQLNVSSGKNKPKAPQSQMSHARTRVRNTKVEDTHFTRPSKSTDKFFSALLLPLPPLLLLLLLLSARSYLFTYVLFTRGKNNAVFGFAFLLSAVCIPEHI